MPMRKRPLMATLVLAALTAAFACAMPSAAAGKQRKAVIVVLHGLSWEEFAAAKSPALQSLLSRASLGVMNSRQLDSPEEFAPYVTIGAGRGATTDRSDPRTSDQLLTWHITAPLAQRMPDVERLREANRRAHTQAEPGLLASLLHENGRRSGYLWVLPGRPWARLAAAIAMDRTGGVHWMAYTSPGARNVSQGRVWREIDFISEGLRRADLLVIDAAISSYLEWGRERPPKPDAPDPKGLSALNGLDPLFADVAGAIETTETLLVITSPTCPPYRSPKYVSYAPIAIIGPGFGPGLLTSGSSRRAGMVSNVDIAPTVLRFFGIDQRAAAARLGVTPMAGHVITAAPADQALRRILAISRNGVRLVAIQWRMGPVYAISQFVAMVVGGGALLLVPGWALRSRRRLRLMLLLSMSLPLALLFLGVLDTGGAARPYILLAGLTATLAWISFVGSPPLTAMGAVLTATAAIITLDAVTGEHLLHNFIVNFGAYATRLYGIHNETMGLLVACAAIGAAALGQQRGPSRRVVWALGLWLALITAAIGAPFWGANWGGAVTAAFAFTVVIAAIRAGRPRARHWLAGIGVAAAVGAFIVALDMIGNLRAESHIGDTAHLIGANGLTAVLAIITRKAHANLQIAVVAPYSLLGLAMLAAAAALVMTPRGGLRRSLEANRILWAGLAGGIVGGLFAVLVNDSGVVSAVAALGVSGAALAYAALQDGPEASAPAAPPPARQEATLLP